MICQSCEKAQATTHVKTIINGELTQYSLCTECARKLGYGNLLTGLGCDFGSLLGGFFGEVKPEDADTLHCKGCKSSFDDIVRGGKVGCAECYHTFYNRLIPLIQRIHGNTTHCGKVPGSESLQPLPKNQLSLMRSELRDAIESENFEHAAILRDRIKELEGGEDHA